MAAAGEAGWNPVESIVFRTQKKYPEYNNIIESNFEPEPEPEPTKPKSKWIENDDDENPENDPAYKVSYDYAKGKNPCMNYTDDSGTNYFVHVKFPIPRMYSYNPDELRKPFLTVRKKIHDLTQYYTSSTFPEAPDGIYTWIVGDNGKFLAGRVRSILEMGTLHKQLADYAKTKHIFVAGECKKEGTTVYFNIQSGTFSLEIIRRKNTTGYNAPTKEQRLLTKGKNIFINMGLTPILLEGNETLINPTNVPITKEELQTYVESGFNVLLYEKREECLSDLFSKNYPRGIRLRGGGKRTRRRRGRRSTRKRS